MHIYGDSMTFPWVPPSNQIRSLKGYALLLFTDGSLLIYWRFYFSALRDKQQSKPTLRDLQSKSGSSIVPNPIPAFTSEPPGALLNSQPGLGATLLDMSPTHTEAPPAEVTLADVFVPLESIKPSKSTRTSGWFSSYNLSKALFCDRCCCFCLHLSLFPPVLSAFR